MPKIYTYGKSKAPSNWQEASDAMRRTKKRKAKKGPSLMEKLSGIEKMLKEKD